MPGLPGTGLGGIFYLLLVVWMPLRELLRPHAPGGRRWRRISYLLSMGGAIVMALWIEGLLLKRLLTAHPVEAVVVPAAATAEVRDWVVPTLPIVPFVTLAGLIALVHILRIRASRSGRSESRAPVDLPPSLDRLRSIPDAESIAVKHHPQVLEHQTGARLYGAVGRPRRRLLSSR